jgi:hypothetical protein
MGSLVCRSCGLRIYSTVSLAALYREERGCPSCGAPLSVDRRQTSLRQTVRRQNPPAAPGPPAGERRTLEDRRSGQPRRAST